MTIVGILTKIVYFIPMVIVVIACGITKLFINDRDCEFLSEF